MNKEPGGRRNEKKLLPTKRKDDFAGTHPILGWIREFCW